MQKNTSKNVNADGGATTFKAPKPQSPFTWLLRGPERGKDETDLSIRPAVKRKGFTVLELLVVTAVIGGVMALTLPALSSAKRRSQYVQCMANQRELRQGVEACASDYWPSGNLSSMWVITYQYDQSGNVIGESAYLSDDGNNFYNDLYRLFSGGAPPDPFLKGFVRPRLQNCPTAKMGRFTSTFNIEDAPNGSTSPMLTTTAIWPQGLDASRPQTDDRYTPAVIYDMPPVPSPLTETISGQTVTFDTAYLHGERGPGILQAFANGAIRWVPGPFQY